MTKNFIGTALSLLVAVSAAAQQPTPIPASDQRWQAWIGCWQLLGETGSGRVGVQTGTRVCVAPTATGVTLTTLVGSEKVLEETIVADGSAQTVRDAECRGTKRSEWSKAVPRLYSAADISCGDQAPRKISSLSMMMPGPIWVDIQSIDIEGRKNIRIRRYERAAADRSQARGTSLSPFAGETRWTIADVKEASGKLAPETVQAALVELKSGFELKSKQLLELDEAGVADSIVDLMVALSYPERFQIERPVSTASMPSDYGYGIYDSYGAMWPFYLDSMFWPSYYSPFAYRYWGSYDPYYFPGAGYVAIEPGETGPVASGQGRVVDGRGYTRVRTRAPEPVRVSGGGVSNGTTSSGGSSSGGNSSSGSSGASSGGYSSGGSGSSGGRTAVPRPPG